MRHVVSGIVALIGIGLLSPTATFAQGTSRVTAQQTRPPSSPFSPDWAKPNQPTGGGYIYMDPRLQNLGQSNRQRPRPGVAGRTTR